jgi:hypothetical protein
MLTLSGKTLDEIAIERLREWEPKACDMNISYQQPKTTAACVCRCNEAGGYMTEREIMDNFVVVTTDSSRRGVFGGELISHENDVVVLENAMMCVYWSTETRGVLGLASIGPQKGSRITPPVPRITLNGVTAVMCATPEAVVKWRDQPWG